MPSRRTPPRHAPATATNPRWSLPHPANRPAPLPWSSFSPHSVVPTIMAGTRPATTPSHDARRTSNHALLLQAHYLIGRQPKPVAINLYVVLTHHRAWHGGDLVGAVQAQRCRRHDDVAKVRMIDALQHAAAMHMRIVHHLRHGAHRRAGDAIILGCREHVHLAVLPGPFGDD